MTYPTRRDIRSRYRVLLFLAVLYGILFTVAVHGMATAGATAGHVVSLFIFGGLGALTLWGVRRVGRELEAQ